MTEKPKINLKALYNSFAHNPEGMWILESSNAIDLYEYIKKNSFKRVLDLGTGIGASSAIVSLAFQDKGETDYKIDSIEQYDKCIKLANELIPEELKKNLTIYKSDVEVWSTEKIPYQYFSSYKKLPEGEYDFIINDGPAFFEENGHFIDLPNGTIMKLLLEGKIKAKTHILYDGRISSLKIIERYFGDNFLMVNLPPKGRDFHIIERIEGEVIFKDSYFESIKTQTPYFNGQDTKKAEDKTGK